MTFWRSNEVCEGRVCACMTDDDWPIGSSEGVWLTSDTIIRNDNDDTI